MSIAVFSSSYIVGVIRTRAQASTSELLFDPGQLESSMMYLTISGLMPITSQKP